MLDETNNNRPERRSALIAHELSRLVSTLPPLARSDSQEKAAFKSMALDTPSSGQRNLQQRSTFQVLVSWSAPLSPPSWKICQLVIPVIFWPSTQPKNTIPRWYTGRKWHIPMASNRKRSRGRIKAYDMGQGDGPIVPLQWCTGRE